MVVAMMAAAHPPSIHGVICMWCYHVRGSADRAGRQLAIKQRMYQKKTDMQCESNVSVQVRFSEVRVEGFVSKGFFTQLAFGNISGEQLSPQVDHCLSIYGITVWNSVACVSFVLCLLEVCGRSNCMSTVGDSSDGLPVHRPSIHVPVSMYVRVDVSPGLPLGRASEMYTV